MKYLLLFISITNFTTFLAFGIDKYKAVKDRWRIPEKTLLLMGLMFGSIGQLAGMKVFHHKTHKWYFWRRGILSLLLQITLVWFVYTKIVL